MSFKPRQHSRRWMLKAGLIAVTCAGVVMATMARPIYKHVDEQGNVSYSDSPQSQDARPMELPPINTQISETAGAGELPRAIKPGSEQADYSIRIESPANDTTIPPGQSSVTITGRLEPSASFSARYELLFDGEFNQSANSPVFTIDQLNRGTHSVAIRVIDEYGVNIATSQSIQIHVQRPTVSR